MWDSCLVGQLLIQVRVVLDAHQMSFSLSHCLMISFYQIFDLIWLLSVLVVGASGERPLMEEYENFI